MKVVAVVLLWPFLTLAQERGHVRDSARLLDAVVISANNTPELRSKVPQQVVAISDDKIAQLNLRTMADVLTSSGTVAVQKSQQGGGSPQIRGFEASRVLLVVDGVRMNNLIYRSGHLQNVITVDPNALARAEILHGPSSTVYGSDALGGVIHLMTKDPLLSDDNGLRIEANGMLRFGTVNNEKTTHADVSLGSKRFASFSSITYSDFDDLRMGERINPAYGQKFGLRAFYVRPAMDNSGDIIVRNEDPYLQRFSGYSQIDILQKFLFQPADRIQHKLNVQFSNSSRIPRYDRLTDPDGEGLWNAEWYYGPQTRIMTAYNMTVDAAGRWMDELSLTVAYQNIRESRHTRRFNVRDRRNQIEFVDVLSLTLQLEKLSGRHRLHYGVDAQSSWVDSRAYHVDVVSNERTPAVTRYPDGGSHMHNFAVYATDAYEISDKFDITGGVRAGISKMSAAFRDTSFFDFPFRDVRQTNHYASGNAGLVFRPDKNWRFSVLASTGFRVPNVDDLGKVFDTEAGQSLILPNPDIRPEKTLNFDLSVSRYLGSGLYWENTAFYTFFFDAIVVDDYAFKGESEINFEGQLTKVMANQNKRAARLLGFTSTLRGSLSKAFSLEAAYTYTSGKIKAGSGDTPLDHIPPAFGRMSLQYHPNKFTAEALVNFSGWKKIEDYLLNSEDNEAYATPLGMPGWSTLDIHLAYDLDPRMTLQAGVDNIMDLQYRTFSSGINAPGRNLFFALRVAL